MYTDINAEILNVLPLQIPFIPHTHYAASSNDIESVLAKLRLPNFPEIYMNDPEHNFWTVRRESLEQRETKPRGNNNTNHANSTAARRPTNFVEARPPLITISQLSPGSFPFPIPNEVLASISRRAGFSFSVIYLVSPAFLLRVVSNLFHKTVISTLGAFHVDSR